MSQRNVGNDNTNVRGNNNDLRKYENHYHFGSQPINRSIVYIFCVEFSKMELSPESEYELINPSGIEEKMDYNDIHLYRDIFTDCSHYLEDVESILEEIPNRELLVKNINTVYKKTRRFEEWEDADHLCHLIFTYLDKRVAENQDLIEEQKNEAIHAIMYYAFTKCKLLEPMSKSIHR